MSGCRISGSVLRAVQARVVDGGRLALSDDEEMSGMRMVDMMIWKFSKASHDTTDPVAAHATPSITATPSLAPLPLTGSTTPRQ